MNLKKKCSKLKHIDIVDTLFCIFSGAQYIFRYRKYQLAENLGEPDSPAHTPRASLASIQLGQLASRAASTSTLLSEVVSLVKFRPRDRMKHSRLRESIDCETMENYDDTSCFQQKSQR